jgi:putative membrane protein
VHREPARGPSRPPAGTRSKSAPGAARHTLILAVDRDDDLGHKTGIEGPVIGPEAMEQAARSLSLADPEDSDTNTLWATLKAHREASTQASPGEQYSVACITGDRRVGTKSDRRLVEQFEHLLNALQPDRLIVVTDGAEDEHILPILESRIPLDAVQRVVVKQSRDLEGAYYLLVRLFEDDRMRRRFILPASLAILVFGAAFALGHIALAVGGMLFTLGLFLLIHAMGWDDPLGRVARDFYDGLRSGKMSFFTSILAIALISFGVLRAYTDLHRTPELGDPMILAAQTDPLLLTLLMLSMTLWWIVGGLALNILGRAVDDLFRTHTTRGLYWRLLFGLPAVGLILQGLLFAATQWRTGTPLPAPMLEPTFYTPVTVGLLLALIGNYTFRYVQDNLRDDEGPPRESVGPAPDEERIRMPPKKPRNRDRHASAAASQEHP